MMSDCNQHEILRKMGQLNCKAAEVFTDKQKVQQSILFSVLKLSGSLALNFNRLKVELLVYNQLLFKERLKKIKMINYW